LTTKLKFITIYGNILTVMLKTIQQHMHLYKRMKKIFYELD